MAFNFPDSPSVNDEYTAGDRTWVWDGTVWLDKGSTLSFSELGDSTHATTHELGGTDEIEIAQSQVTGLDAGTEGFTAVSNGTAGLSYQPISHNYIINGAFDIWQRGDSFSSVAFEYTADRWFLTGTANDVDITKEEFTPEELEAEGFGDAKYYLRQNSVGSTSGQNRFEQRIEDVRTLAGQQVTLSFYAKGTASSYTVFIRQIFGSGGSAISSKEAGSFTPTTTWQRFSFTVQLDGLSGITIGTTNYLEIRLRNDTDSDNVFDLWGVQLEAGSIATPFKRNANSIQGELAACQRYYIRHSSADNANGFVVYGTGPQYSSTQCLVDFTFPVTMRATPTGSFSGNFQTLGNASLTGSVNISRASTKNASINIGVSGGTVGDSVMLRDNDDQTAYLELSAEL